MLKIMKLNKPFLILIILFASFQIGFGQEKTKAILLDSVSEFTCEDLLSRLDSFAFEINKNPQSVGYAVIKGGANPVKNKFLERYITGYAVSREFGQNRFVIIPDSLENELKIEFWISKDGESTLNIKPNNFTYNLLKTDKPINFVGDTVEIAKIDGKLTFFSYCPACCIETVNLFLLSEFLKANSQLNAHIKIYGNKRKRAKLLEKLIRDEAKNDYEIPINRLKFGYGGIDEGIAQLGDNVANVEIKFIPVK